MKSYLHAPELTDDVIEKAFEGTNFGRTDYREFLGYSVLKKACGWHCGHTITTIMIEMGLITPKKGGLTKLGRMFLSDCYDDPLRTATHPAASVPDGWKLVPVEPTEQMMLNGTGCQHHAWDDKDCSARQTRRYIWQHMVEAAPAPGDGDA